MVDADLRAMGQDLPNGQGSHPKENAVIPRQVGVIVD